MGQIFAVFVVSDCENFIHEILSMRILPAKILTACEGVRCVDH